MMWSTSVDDNRDMYTIDVPDQMAVVRNELVERLETLLRAALLHKANCMRAYSQSMDGNAGTGMNALTSKNDEHGNGDADGVIDVPHYGAHTRTPTQQEDQGILINGLGKLDQQWLRSRHRELVVSVLYKQPRDARSRKTDRRRDTKVGQGILIDQT